MPDVEPMSLLEEFRRQNEELARTVYPPVPNSFLDNAAEHHSIATPQPMRTAMSASALEFSPVTNVDWQDKVQKCLIEMDNKLDIVVEFVNETDGPDIEQAPLAADVDSLDAAEGLDAIEAEQGCFNKE